MNPDNPFCIVGYQRQTVLYRVETCLSAVGEQIFYIEMVLLTELAPISGNTRMICRLAS